VTPITPGTVCTHGPIWCGVCFECLSADNPGEWNGYRWTCAACLIAALVRIHEAMIARESGEWRE
jgi:hypothetical protein